MRRLPRRTIWRQNWSAWLSGKLKQRRGDHAGAARALAPAAAAAGRAAAACGGLGATAPTLSARALSLQDGGPVSRPERARAHALATACFVATATRWAECALAARGAGAADAPVLQSASRALCEAARRASVDYSDTNAMQTRFGDDALRLGGHAPNARPPLTVLNVPVPVGGTRTVTVPVRLTLRDPPSSVPDAAQSTRTVARPASSTPRRACPRSRSPRTSTPGAVASA